MSRKRLRKKIAKRKQAQAEPCKKEDGLRPKVAFRQSYMTRIFLREAEERKSPVCGLTDFISKKSSTETVSFEDAVSWLKKRKSAPHPELALPDLIES